MAGTRVIGERYRLTGTHVAAGGMRRILGFLGLTPPTHADPVDREELLLEAVDDIAAAYDDVRREWDEVMMLRSDAEHQVGDAK